ncbi:hypothetical protein MUK42_32962 [Musa troglodytarum]|uniref:Uncharacterized protein n=1 Tax=Musa troglodytarum TaxID=320322 RepID=A0A9E7GJW7_9LILI|nr:hypothetical protein MUK42_32962 [Musa troglodytarum]
MHATDEKGIKSKTDKTFPRPTPQHKMGSSAAAIADALSSLSLRPPSHRSSLLSSFPAGRSGTGPITGSRSESSR